MKRGVLQISSLLTAGALFTTGCSNLSPGENAGVFGAAGGAAAGAIARAAGMSTADSIATGVAAGALIGAVTYVIAKHEATERQRRVAEARARVIAARMNARESQGARHSSNASPGQQHSRRTSAKTPRYIAVDTVRDERTAPRAEKSVMIFDTQAGHVVGNNVYDVQTPPRVGTTARFDTYSAQYVGSGI